LVKPVDIVHAGDDRLFVVEQRGTIQILDASGTLLTEPFLDIQSAVNSNGNERGLLGLAFHPNYANNGYFYLNYTGAGGQTRIVRYQVSANDPNRADPSSEQLLLAVDQPYANHNAGDLAFGSDGYLYIPLGDGGSGGDPQDNGQDLSSLLGKILRLDVDGGNPYAIPADNPFVNDANARDEIWSWGWRNPWRISFDRQTNDLWVGDVGQNDYEEISFEAAGTPGGRNYGWRCYEGNATFNLGGCNGSGYVSPIFDYTHSQARSVTGGFVYRGSAFPDLQGMYFFGDYMNGEFWMTQPDGNGGWQTTPLGQYEPFGRFDLSTFGEGATGELYVAAHSQGEVYQLRQAGVTALPQATSPLTLYPQPWVDHLHIERPASATGSLKLTLYDLQGRRLQQQRFSADEDINLGQPQLPAGLYLLDLQADSQTWRGKVLIR
jgi:glucose/arabinose dehydrogenase